jgi:hypothetical protein
MSDRPLGQWDHKFTFAEEMGCLPALGGFIVFVAVVLIVYRVLFD